MKTLDLIQTTKQYLNYLEDHINNVNRAWKEIQDKCKDMRFIYDDYVFFMINGEVEYHDISKLSKAEFTSYRDEFFPVVDQKNKKGFPGAWKNHLKKNNHHWENWTIKKKGYIYELEACCVHMVIDWLAMSYKFNDTPRNYYEKNKDKIKLPTWAISFIYEIFERIE